LLGDYNKDGTVDAADYVVWRHSVGQTGAVLAADGDQDYQVDADDYNVWRAHFGQTAGSSAALQSAPSLSVPIPEPTAIAFALLGLVETMFFRLRKNQSAHIS